jgi:hypothetical protein
MEAKARPGGIMRAFWEPQITTSKPHVGGDVIGHQGADRIHHQHRVGLRR